MPTSRTPRDTEAFPEFLTSDPYPADASSRPISAISSQMSSAYETAASERSGGPISPLSATGPVGEPGLPPSRPTTATTAQGESASRAGIPVTSTRRGPGVFGRTQEPMFIPNSRPTSSLGRNHVPSITAQGFSRPMSPTTLQAQRNQAGSPTFNAPAKQSQRDATASTRPSGADREDPTRPHRYSDASLNTIRSGRPVTRPEDVPPMPSSRAASDFVYGSDTGRSVISKNSMTPLQQKQQLQQQKDLPRNRSFRLNSAVSQKPRSFRASFLSSRRSSRRDVTDQQRNSNHGHEKLPSNPTSPDNFSMHKPLPSAPTASSKQQVSTHRNYEYFAGNSAFFCFGAFLNTKAAPLNSATFVLVLIPGALFFAGSASWLWHNISPAMPLVLAYIFFLTVSAFLHAAFSDPGILPRNLHPHPPNPDEERDALTPGPPTTEWIMVRTFPSSISPSADTSALESGQPATAMEVPTKYCKTCQIWRPPRCHHCRICDACIEGHDHHCVWLNQCVGKRNYRFFLSFVGWATVFGLAVISFCLVHIGYYARDNKISFGDAVHGRWEERMALAAFIYAVLAMPYPGSLFIYHIFLMSRGETTREYLNSHKFPLKDRHRPFAMESAWKNLAVVMSRPRPPSYMQFKRRYVEGDARLGFMTTRSERKENAEKEEKKKEERVRDLTSRFSILGAGGREKGGNANGTTGAVNKARQREVELKSLPAPPPQPPPKSPLGYGRGFGDSGVGVNSTPR